MGWSGDVWGRKRLAGTWERKVQAEVGCGEPRLEEARQPGYTPWAQEGQREAVEVRVWQEERGWSVEAAGAQCS